MRSPLLTDLYQLTMGHAYWKAGLAEREAVFHLFYRRAPFGGEATITAGIGPAADFLDGLCFSGEELAYLAALRGADGGALFEGGYLDYLRDLDWALEVDVIPEGAVSFPHEPLVRVRGPLLQGQLIETALLNIVNFQTLVATQAARLCEAAGGDPIFEFGLRRAQGPDGGLSASRAAYIGGCAATSNVLAGMRYGVPVKGTHAHSWVMSFDDEQEAFDAYAEAMPNNVVLLVDTYDTLDGVRNAIETGRRLRARGHDLLGIRLDSGDLAALSIRARELLDTAGFHDTRIVASNDLDEVSIRDLKAQGARIDIWGVGTKLATAAAQPALGGVYKLGAIRGDDAAWQLRVKLSNDLIKVSNPGILQVARESDDRGRMVRDVLYNEMDSKAVVPAGSRPLLVPAVRHGRRVLPEEPVDAIRDRAMAGWRALTTCPPRFSLDPSLEETKRKLLIAHGFQP
jgi:nicotinate phosphoribosyltransferase